MDLPKAEEKILEYWDSIDIIKLILEAKKPKKYYFTEGPPTANGLPGIHHVYSRSIKDIVLRFKFMDGYWVPRKAGWDTHGLPVELEIEKELGLKTKKDIVDYGIDKFNEKCRESVFRYVKEWEKLTKRMAFWLDMNNPYITCENYFIESIWWSLKVMFDKGIVYKGKKVVPFCPRCETPLSTHEISLGYENVKEESIYIKFKLLDPNFEGAKIVAWTTTPWTLLSNIALAANSDSRYSLIEYNGEKLIVATALINNIAEEGSYTKIREFFGLDLLYKKYEPLFPYFAHLSEKNGYIVITADFVDTEPSSENISTGFVHIAPAFGEDDYNVGLQYDLPFIQPINEKGYFDKSVPLLEGKYFKIHREDIHKKGVWDTDKWVVDELKKMDKLFGNPKDYTHDYPFCWRCKRALIYYARESWFIQMSRFREELLETNSKVNWVPDFIGTGRFGNFLDGVRDWAVSRERFWGTPLPIWICSNKKCNHILVIGSYEELKELSKNNVVLQDYHKPMIDEVVIPCPKCKTDMIRTSEVIDCWYDSGAAPFAQYHYPFENKELVEKESYPMDFIAEGMDQTRGWFYTLHAIATVVFNHNAFRNVVVNGIVLDGEGQKMSKSLGNTIDPWSIFNSQGSDALRWLYYVSGPPHKEKRLSIENVKYIVSQFISKYWNSFLLFLNNAKSHKTKPILDFNVQNLKNPLDIWIISKVNSVIMEVKELLDKYLIFDSADIIQRFIIDDLSNWYLRLARKRFLDKDQDVYNVVYYIFDRINRCIAPFVPFLTEQVFLELQKNFNYFKNEKSVHLLDFPVGDQQLINSDLLNDMNTLINLIQDLRGLREQVKIKTRQSLKEYLLNINDEIRKVAEKYEILIKSEVNVKNLIFIDENEAKSLYTESIVLNKGAIGKDFKQNRLRIEKYLQTTNLEEIKKNIIKGKLKIKLEDKEYELTKEHFQIEQEAKEPYVVKVNNYGILFINKELDKELLQEGFAREFVRNIQNIRKQLDLSRGKEKIIINAIGDLDIEQELGDFLEFVKKETSCIKFGKNKKGKLFNFKIQQKKIDIMVEIIKK